MPEVDTNSKEKQYHPEIPHKTKPFLLKGSGSYDWGMKNRLARTFDPRSGRTVMLAVDHGYFQGPTTGLERIDISIVPLIPYCDALFCTRGILRSLVPPQSRKPMVLRASGGPSILKELSNEEIAMDMEDALRLNASGVGIQVFVGGEFETRSIHNMTRLVDLGIRHGMPVMGVTAVGKDMKRDAQYFRLACRMIAELGATYVKTYFAEKEFETITASCPVPIVMAGGKKLPELDALMMAYNAIQGGASGVDMGRNIFQSDDPVAMIQAVCAVVHKNMKPEHALDLYQTQKSKHASKKKNGNNDLT
jgi:putative autoinducer-2 (AI-2) aldolase